MKWMQQLKKKFRKAAVLALVGILFAGNAGCSKPAEEGYNIFFKNESGTKLLSVKYETNTTGETALVKELIEQMQHPDKKAGCVGLMPAYVSLDRIEILTSTANLYFDKGYNDMPSEAELLLRAGLVKTVTQVPGVQYVQIYVEEVAAQYSDGRNMGRLDADDFIDDSVSGMDSIEWRNVQFYYANSLGDKLVRKSERIAYSKNVSIEKVVMERLIQGPSGDDLRETLPAGLKLLSISVSDGVCYVNLDSSFMTEMVNVSSEIPVYSIVNTLCSLNGIRAVQIMINGDSTKMYRETVPLDSNLTFNRELVG